MDEQPNQGNETGPRVPLVVWAICAFVPAVVGAAMLQGMNLTNASGPIWLVVDFVFSLAGGFGLCSRMKEPFSRALVSLLLSGFFFLFNIVVVAFVGCSRMAGI